ncbi:hypothetical protein GCM10009863_65790 [Streptomyces axinellae]|uniref:Integrase n=1 Tax=Streptomyces axinellae TaxID=552788 RepID=A0ABN3R024_9ACTN
MSPEARKAVRAIHTRGPAAITTHTMRKACEKTFRVPPSDTLPGLLPRRAEASAGGRASEGVPPSAGAGVGAVVMMVWLPPSQYSIRSRFPSLIMINEKITLRTRRTTPREVA